MDAIANLLKLDISSLVFSLFILMSGTISLAAMIGKFSEMIGRPVSWIARRNQDHEITLQNARAIKELSEKHQESVRQSIRHDEMIRRELEQLTEMLIKKEINDMRWEIIGVADDISNGKQISKECYIHCIHTYEDYEEIIKKQNISNGEVEISMQIVNDSYREKLKKGRIS